tara:strand:+ start:1778 stop:2188 length:411 start_codon:yes stop_codon:yes gene_type:complete
MKSEMIEALYQFTAQRSGIDWKNYGGSQEAFMQDYRRILRDGRDARVMLRAVEANYLLENILAEQLESGRLTWDGKRLEFTACQYFPTEYRAAVCRALASALWRFWGGLGGRTSCDQIRADARRSLSPGIAKRWFN